MANYPNLDIFIGALDEKLSNTGMILPGTPSPFPPPSFLLPSFRSSTSTITFTFSLIPSPFPPTPSHNLPSPPPLSPHPLSYHLPSPPLIPLHPLSNLPSPFPKASETLAIVCSPPPLISPHPLSYHLPSPPLPLSSPLSPSHPPSPPLISSPLSLFPRLRRRWRSFVLHALRCTPVHRRLFRGAFGSVGSGGGVLVVVIVFLRYVPTVLIDNKGFC